MPDGESHAANRYGCGVIPITLEAIRVAKVATILSGRFEQIGEVRLDERRRVSRAKALDFLKESLGETVTADFSVSVNEMGKFYCPLK
jgi:hypothetical protein